MHVLPRPRISSIIPAVIPAASGIPLTIRGLYFEPRVVSARAVCNFEETCSVGATRVFVGGVQCNRSTVVSDIEVVCMPAEGLGSHEVAVSVFEDSVTVRTGTREAAVLQGTLHYGGSLSGGLGGYAGSHTGGDGPEATLLGTDIVDATVRAIAFLRGDMYIGGSFMKGSADNKVSYVGVVLGGGIVLPLSNGVDGSVNALARYQGMLVVGGAFSRVFDLGMRGSASRGIAGWDGHSWHLFGGGNLGGLVNNLLVNASVMYVGGRFDTPDRRNNIAVWDGVQWTSLCGRGEVSCGVSGGEVHVMAIMGRELFVGGSFVRAGDAPAGHIAKWDGAR